jgi:hypothetical protein
MRIVSVEGMEKARHAEEKGAILEALREDYAREMTSVRSLSRALDLLGHSMRAEALQFALAYLADSGYLRTWRSKDVPGFRRDRISDVADSIVFAKLTPKGLRLIDGYEPEDPGVMF